MPSFHCSIVLSAEARFSLLLGMKYESMAQTTKMSWSGIFAWALSVRCKLIRDRVDGLRKSSQKCDSWLENWRHRSTMSRDVWRVWVLFVTVVTNNFSLSLSHFYRIKMRYLIPHGLFMIDVTSTINTLLLTSKVSACSQHKIYAWLLYTYIWPQRLSTRKSTQCVDKMWYNFMSKRLHVAKAVEVRQTSVRSQHKRMIFRLRPLHQMKINSFERHICLMSGESLNRIDGYLFGVW